jgi:hypothetical protein
LSLSPTGQTVLFLETPEQSGRLHACRQTGSWPRCLNFSIKTIRIRLGHESLDVTLAYLKGKDAESEEAQEHANSSSLALYA